jgi:hypothetical protein
MMTKEERSVYRKEYYIKHKARDNALNREWKRTKRLSRYGLTREQYEHMYTVQSGKCAICDKTIAGSKSTIDHCHSTGRVRGLLCIQCNTILGMAHDDVRILRHAINYLAKCL